MTDGFLSGECKHKRVRDLREHSKPKLKWQENIQAFLSYVAQASLLLLMVSPTTKALLLLLALSSCSYLCSLAIAHNFLFQLMFSCRCLCSCIYLHFLDVIHTFGSWSPPPTCVILISPIKYPLYYLVFFPFILHSMFSHFVVQCSSIHWLSFHVLLSCLPLLPMHTCGLLLILNFEL